jgi:hypothetical protein
MHHTRCEIPLKDRVVGDVVGIQAQQNNNLCDSEVICRRVENTIQYRRQVRIAKFHRAPRKEPKSDR